MFKKIIQVAWILVAVVFLFLLHQWIKAQSVVFLQEGFNIVKVDKAKRSMQYFSIADVAKRKTVKVK